MRFLIITSILFTACSGGNLTGSGAASKKSQGNRCDQKADKARCVEVEPPVPGKPETPDVCAAGDTDCLKKLTDSRQKDPNDPKSPFANSRLNLAFLTNDVKCALCHVTITGDVLSIGNVTNFSAPHAPTTADAPTREVVNGAWFAAQDFSNSTSPDYLKHKQYLDANNSAAKPQEQRPYVVNASGGIHKNLKLSDFLPNDLDGDGLADFPAINLAGMATKAKGTVSGATHDIKGDNLVLAGTAENPITLSGDVYVKGDVIIKGVYTGKGTIYAEGNIYIAADITAKNSVFPYPSSPEEAHTKAQQSIASTDALGLAAKAIFIGKIGDSSKHDKDFSSLIYGHPLTDETRAATNVDHVFSWYPATDYFKLQSQSGVDCSGTSQAANKGSVYRIDAFLYGRERIEGASGGTGWVINGGVITEKFHFRPGGGNCVGDTGRSHVNFDYRMTLNDINILMELKPWFEKTTK